MICNLVNYALQMLNAFGALIIKSVKLGILWELSTVSVKTLSILNAQFQVVLVCQTARFAFNNQLAGGVIMGPPVIELILNKQVTVILSISIIKAILVKAIALLKIQLNRVLQLNLQMNHKQIGIFAQTMSYYRISKFKKIPQQLNYKCIETRKRNFRRKAISRSPLIQGQR